MFMNKHLMRITVAKQCEQLTEVRSKENKYKTTRGRYEHNRKEELLVALGR